jgi:hypothetical protein
MLKTRPHPLLLTLTLTLILTLMVVFASSTLGDGTPTLVFSRHTARMFKETLVRHYLGSELKLTGTVYDNGEPDANITVTATPADPVSPTSATSATSTTTTPAAPPPPVAQAVSDVTGHFELVIPRANSRAIQVTADGPATPVTLIEHVRASIGLRVRALPHARLLFTGRVIVQPGTGLPWVILQDHTPLGWQTFAAMSVKAKGRFRYTLRVERADIGHTFVFRARTPPTSHWWGAITFTHPATIK